jgi:hypothetical protein
MSTIIVAWIFCSPLISLWTCCLYIKQASECRNLILYQRTVAPLHHYTMRKNATKSHHLLYLWQQEKNKPTPTTYCIYDNAKKMDSYWIPFIVNVINDCHNNSRVVKGRQQEKLYIVKVLVAMWHSEISDYILNPHVYLH